MKYRLFYVLLLVLIILPISMGKQKGQAENILKRYALMPSYQDIEASEKNILKKLESVAHLKGIELMDDAKDSIVMELVRTNIYEGKQLSEIPESELENLLDQIVIYTKNKKVSGINIRNYKIDQITKNFEIEIKDALSGSKVSIDDETLSLIIAEMSKLTKSSEESGLTLKEISDRNKRYFKLLFKSLKQKLVSKSGDSRGFYNWGGITITETGYHIQGLETINRIDKVMYQQVSLGINLNKPRVTVHINTIPEGADVFVNDCKIGKTLILWNFDCDKDYNLTFNLKRFRKHTRPYRFTVSDEEQPILEILHKAE